MLQCRQDAGVSKIFGDFDQAGLDAAYNNRAHVPDHGDYFARWARQSDEARAALAHRADLRYGRAPRQRLDYFPAAQADAPLLVFIHGGYWQAFDHKPFALLAPGFVAGGVAFASMSHSLCPDIDMARLVEQLREGLAWLWGRAGELGFDRERIFVAGHSAGGHLAALLAQTDFVQRGLPADAIKGGLALSGLYDLEPIRLSYLNAALQLDQATARRLSPLHNVRLPRSAAAARCAPLLLAVGAAELPEYPRQQRQYQAALRRAGVPCRGLELEGLHHMDVIEALGQPGHALHQAVKHMISSGSVV
jgi:arylformamidase